tara:strand:- start:26820 stop:27059 length:240 start_codon:yes stop_codon:yes gene_type:complete
MALYELLIRGKSDGTISGSHAIDFVDGRPGDPRPIAAEDWPAVASDVNSLLSSKITELEAEIVALKAEPEPEPEPEPAP